MVQQTMATVLKKHQVELSGSVLLDIGSSATPAAPAVNHGAPASATIVETNETYATIELVCSCGTKTYLQCNYS
jgi:hypothetical protein